MKQMKKGDLGEKKAQTVNEEKVISDFLPEASRSKIKTLAPRASRAATL
jgi:hypothetical protein